MSSVDLQAALPDRYRVLSELGRGGMATVYLAEDVQLDRKVAIKVLSPELGSSIDAERFRREIQIAARLTHPNILSAYDSGQAKGLYFYVMPYVEGLSVRARIDKEGQLPVEDAVAIACEVCDALAYAHAQGIVHRDIKPENILLQNGHAVVADFGIARLVQEGGEKLTKTGMSIGTAEYMSPEQFSGEKVDGRSDLYALACVLYEMLVGEPPFTGPNMLAIMARAAIQPVPSIRLVRPGVPEPIEMAIMIALAKTPADRFAEVSEFKDALLGSGIALAKHTRAYTAAYTAAFPTERVVPMWKRPVTWAAAAALVALSAGGAWYRQSTQMAQMAALGDGARQIGVLYFDDGSADGSLRPVADGLTEGLIEELAVVPTLRVRSATAVQPFRGRDVPYDSVRAALDVGMIIRGEVTPGGPGARLNVRLVDAQSGVDIDRARFDIDTANALAAQDAVVQGVAEFLRNKVGLEVQLRESRARTSSPQAWTLVQRAQKRLKDADSLINRARQPAQGMPALDAADAELGRALALDGAWSEPLIARAAVAYQRARANRTEPAVANSALDSGTVHISRALEIDPRSADAHELRGRLAFARVELRTIPEGAEWEGHLQRAEADLRRAVSINPNQASAYETLSRVAFARKAPIEALEAARNAYAADAYLRNARAIIGGLFWGYFDTENFPEARRWCDEGRRRFPADGVFVQCSLYLMTAKGGNPDPAMAWQLADTIRSLAGPTTRAYHDHLARTLVGGVLGKAGLRDSADRVLVAARAGPDIDPEQEIIGREIMMRLIYGDYDTAITRLATYLQIHPDHRKALANQTVWYWRDPGVQNDSRFQRLIAGAR